MDKTLKIAILSLVSNVAYSAYNIVFGVLTHSWWFIAVGLYFVILSAVRFVVILSKKSNSNSPKFTGGMLISLSLPLAATVFLSVISDRGHKFHMIAMIAIATYAFTKITLATINLIKSRHSASGQMIALRNISFADAFVSIFSLQRSMLVTFEGMTNVEITIMNACTGSAVCIIVFLLGLNLVTNKNILFKSLNKQKSER